eukprot:m.238938 g.238938  ORF g.238938 m.238938 type:complete len:367 (+) comp13392_c0_seq1:1025-2125(+)
MHLAHAARTHTRQLLGVAHDRDAGLLAASLGAGGDNRHDIGAGIEGATEDERGVDGQPGREVVGHVQPDLRRQRDRRVDGVAHGELRTRRLDPRDVDGRASERARVWAAQAKLADRIAVAAPVRPRLPVLCRQRDDRLALGCVAAVGVTRVRPEFREKRGSAQKADVLGDGLEDLRAEILIAYSADERRRAGDHQPAVVVVREHAAGLVLPARHVLDAGPEHLAVQDHAPRDRFVEHEMIGILGPDGRADDVIDALQVEVAGHAGEQKRGIAVDVAREGLVNDLVAEDRHVCKDSRRLAPECRHGVQHAGVIVVQVLVSLSGRLGELVGGPRAGCARAVQRPRERAARLGALHDPEGHAIVEAVQG